MIATWMLSALLFTTLIGVAAHYAEVALRAARQETRWPWLVALAASVIWPSLAPLVRRSLPDSSAIRSVAITLPTIQVVPDQLPAAASWLQQLDVALLALWIVASLFMLARLLRALMLLGRIRKTSECLVVDGVPVLLSANVGPAVLGVVRPSVLLPSALLDLEQPLRRLVLRHEEEHCRARDPWIVLGSALVMVLLPWNLPLWWIVRRARLALEVDCDARVLATESNATQYGKLLLLISQRQSMTTFAPMLAASSSHLERRIAAMLPVRSERRHMRIAVALVATIVAGIAACSSRISDGIVDPKPVVVTRSPNVDPGQPYFEFQVTKMAHHVPGTGNLRYPDSLRSANVEGEVLAQFVVDENGRVIPGSFKVLKSDHSLFTPAVASALPNMRFYPAESKGIKVKQLIQEPFTFALSKEAAIGNAESVPSRRPDGKVTKDAQQIPGTGNLRYPDSLRSANVEGEVVAQFVVDATGQIMPGSLKVIRSTHPLFVRAVETALPSMRFYPAEVDGTKVKELKQQSFTFSLRKE